MRYGNRIFHKRGIKEEAPKWRTDRRVFEAWCEGRTKCDFVNANMRELAATGFMSNRGRQNVASSAWTTSALLGSSKARPPLPSRSPHSSA